MQDLSSKTLKDNVNKKMHLRHVLSEKRHLHNHKKA